MEDLIDDELVSNDSLKQRHIVVTIVLWLLFVGSLFLAIVEYIMWQESHRPYKEIFVNNLLAGCIWLILKFKKIGFLGYALVCLTSLLHSLSFLGAGLDAVINTGFVIAFLYGILQIPKNGTIAWNLLK